MTALPDERKQQAQIYLRRSLNYYEQNNRSAAIKALGIAIDLDRSLRDEPRVQRVAEVLTGERGKGAIAILSSRDSREAAAALQAKPRRPSSNRSPFRLLSAALVLIAAVVSAVTALSTFSGNQAQTERLHLASDANQEYLVTVPSGSTPADGWQVLVAIHGAGQSGQDMVDMLGGTARSRGMILIAPTFPTIHDGTADEATYAAADSTLKQIIDEVRQRGMTNPKLYGNPFGEVILGYAEGAALATYAALNGFDYADSGFVMEGPMGVVLVNANAALYDATRYPIPYLILYGERAPQADVSREYNERLSQQGTEVYMIQADGTGVVMTGEQLAITADFVKQVYYPPTEALPTTQAVAF